MTPVPSSPVALLDQLDELRAKATDGEWGAGDPSARPDGMTNLDAMTRLPESRIYTAVGSTVLPADAALIAAAVNALPELIADLRKHHAAVRAVLEMHRPVGGPRHYDGDESDYCDNDGFIWPCVTFTAVTAALSVTP